MKKVFLSMAALALIMASCSNEEVPGTNPEAVTNAVAIRIGQTVKGLETKAPVVSGSTVKATVLMHDSTENKKDDWQNFTPVYGNTVNSSNSFDSNADRANVSTGTFIATVGTTKADELTGNEVSLAPTLYYPLKSNTQTHAYLSAVAPEGTVDGQTVKMKEVDGLQDVMYAPTVDFGEIPDGGTVTAPQPGICP
ncbi:MAG: hypothetical protein LUH63_05400 [Parabacteroides sp.]|nr:hypothetical protein [Parabacteroides sp.]